MRAGEETVSFLPDRAQLIQIVDKRRCVAVIETGVEGVCRVDSDSGCTL
jgi:hypothetical protein